MRTLAPALLAFVVLLAPALTFTEITAQEITAQEITAEELSDEPSADEPSADDETPAATDLEALELEAEELFADNDTEGAVAAYRRLASLHEKPVEKARVLVSAAWVRFLAEDEEQARVTLREALVLAPAVEFRPENYSDRFRELYIEAKQQAEEQRDLAAYEAAERAIERMRARDWATARAAFQEALGHRPGHPQALYNLALVDLYDGREDEALAGFEKLLALPEGEPGTPTEIGDALRALALTNVGLIYNRRQLFAEAADALERAVELDAGNTAAWINLGVSRRRQGEKASAAEAFRRAHELDPDDPGVMNNLALAYIDTREWVAAVGLLKRATDRHPDNASMWLNLGLAQMGMGNAAGAVESWESAIRNDPRNAGGWANAAALHLANHSLATGDPSRALEVAERILGWRPDSADGWVYKGLAQRARGDREAARQSLEEARRLDPTRAATHNNLGNVYYELRRLDEAEKAFERALAIDPGLTEARQNLAAVRETRRLEREGAAPAAAGTSTPERAAPGARLRLGLRFADIDYAALGLQGVMVDSVLPGSLAARAGLAPRDLILKADGRDVAAPDDVERYVREAGKKRVVLDLLRDNLPHRVELRLD